MVEIIVRAIADLVDSVAGLFHLGHSAEQRLARGSVVGESELDQEARTWRERVLQSWQWISALVLLLGAVGAAVWHSWFR